VKSKLQLQSLEVRDVPATWYTVTLDCPAQGVHGESDLSVTGGGLSATTTAVWADSPADAVRLALTGQVSVGGQTYEVRQGTISENAAVQAPFLLVPMTNGYEVRLEDLAATPQQADWDYNDTTWKVNVSLLPDPPGDTPKPTPQPGDKDPKAEERKKRLEELSKDPDRGGQVSENSKREAEVVLDLEEAGKITGPVRRPDRAKQESGDFIDKNGTAWDVKAPRSREILLDEIEKKTGKRPDADKPIAGEFDLKTEVAKIRQEIKNKEKVILDTGKLTPADRDALVKELEQEIKDKNVIVYPVPKG
jgi:hypothetical protein